MELVRKFTLVQAAARRFLAMQRFARTRECIISLQAATRGLLARKAAYKAAHARQMQAAARGLFARLHFARQRAAVMTLQAGARMYLVRARFLQLRQAALTVRISIYHTLTTYFH